jgi:predicted HAD superfamily Cof-like phosphohydrolase
MIEKFEECPNCGAAGSWWLYDAQKCISCEYDRMVLQAHAQINEMMISHPYLVVKEFHKKFNHPIAQKPVNIDDSTDTETQNLLELRRKLIDEEYKEFRVAYFEGNEIEMLDALCDMIYVIYGMALALGWDINAAVAEVHRSNMSKLGADGKPIVRKDGKIMKGENYSPPNLAQFFKRED